jgi:hypothetical protein
MGCFWFWYRSFAMKRIGPLPITDFVRQAMEAATKGWRLKGEVEIDMKLSAEFEGGSEVCTGGIVLHEEVRFPQLPKEVLDDLGGRGTPIC